MDEFFEIIAEVEEHQERRRRDLLILKVKLLLIDSSEVFARAQPPSGYPRPRALQ